MYDKQMYVKQLKSLKLQSCINNSRLCCIKNFETKTKQDLIDMFGNKNKF